MQKVTPEEIAIIKRIAALVNINHKVVSHWNSVTDDAEQYDCFYDNDRGSSFEWCAAYDSFDDFIRDYAQFKYDSGYQIGACW
jgi:hypothetical protein